MPGYEKIKEEIMQELRTAKNDIVGKIRMKLEEAFGMFSKECRKVPLFCVVSGLSRSYRGKGMVVRRSREVPSTKRPAAKRPSIVLQVENQSFVFDGRGFKGGAIGDQYKGMFKEINDVLKKHIKKL
jgi:hypothetical protein